jgi:pyruvate kinase
VAFSEKRFLRESFFLFEKKAILGKPTKLNANEATSMKHTKIVSTIGPASESKDTLRALIEAGMNVARLNFSHGEHEWHKGVIDRVRALSREMNVSIGILADLQGPRIRVAGNHEISIAKGQRVRVSDGSKGDLPIAMGELVLLDTSGLTDALEVGHEILIDDRSVCLRVVEKLDRYVVAEAESAGVIRPRKGANLPDSKLSLPILSDKDRKDLAFVLEEGVDFVGLSFVGSAQDIDDTREVMRAMLPKDAPLPDIVAKIERKEAVKNLDAILKTTDAVMVARGDLGIEMPETEVAILQKDIIKRSLAALRPVIVATQMMKSMVENPTPTRAEVSDVTNAVIDHCDAVMLSEETAQGKYPVETVSTMREIITKTEESPLDDLLFALDLNLRSDYAVLVRSVYELAKSFRAKAIVLLSVSGFTARLISHFRPETEILVATNNRKTWNKLSLLWGVTGYLFDDDMAFDTQDDRMIKQAKKDGHIQVGDQTVVFLGRVPGERDAHRLVGIREIR